MAGKPNEITANSELVELIEVSGCLVIIKAMDCQKKIASEILNKNSGYLLTLKGKQTLIAEI